MAKAHLIEEVINGQSYWLSPALPRVAADLERVHLLSGFDEYLVSYRDRSASLDPAHQKRWNQGNAVFSSIIVIGGKVVGIWKRTLAKKSVAISVDIFEAITPAQEHAFTEAAARYGKFVGLPVVRT